MFGRGVIQGRRCNVTRRQTAILRFLNRGHLLVELAHDASRLQHTVFRQSDHGAVWFMEDVNPLVSHRLVRVLGERVGERVVGLGGSFHAVRVS